MIILPHRRKAFAAGGDSRAFTTTTNKEHEYIISSDYWTITGAGISDLVDHVAGLDLAQATDANRPLNIASDAGINSLSCMETDGTDFIQSASHTMAQPFTVGLIAKDGDVTSSIARIWANSSGSDVQIIWRDTGDDYRINAGSNVTGDDRDADWHFVLCCFDGASSFIRLNGTEIASGDAGSNGFDGVSLFARDSGDHIPPSGSRLAHCVVWSGNTDTDGTTATIEGDASSIYGTP